MLEDMKEAAIREELRLRARKEEQRLLSERVSRYVREIAVRDAQKRREGYVMPPPDPNAELHWKVLEQELKR